MSAPNVNWARWVLASFAKHFDDHKGSVYLYVEGSDRDTAKKKDFAEFRMDGPRLRQLGPNQWQLTVTVNILVQSTMNDHSIYHMRETIGQMLTGYTDSIIGFRYGDGLDDDSSQFACFRRANEDIRVNDFGIVDEVVRKQQATIECKYIAELEV